MQRLVAVIVLAIAGSAPIPVVGAATAVAEEDSWISPDGRLFLFARDRGGTQDIYMATR